MKAVLVFIRRALIGLALAAIAESANASIIGGEYFIDDPNVAEGAGIAIAAQGDVSTASFAIDQATLSPGSHVVYVRFEDNQTGWGTPVATPFFVAPRTVDSAPKLASAELFVGPDPGVSQGTAFGVSATVAAGARTGIPSEDVTGTGQIGIRLGDSNGNVSSTVILPTFVAPRREAVSTPARLDRIELFVGADPGLDNGLALDVLPMDPLDVTVMGLGQLNISNLSAPFDTVNVRARDQSGLYSLTVAQSLSLRDFDSDGTVDLIDAFPFDPFESQDTDGDGIGNNADSDIDGDGQDNAVDQDDDGDGMDDQYEESNGLDPRNPIDSASDQDNDGLTALEEFQIGTDPANADTDGDGVPDGFDPTPLRVTTLRNLALPGGVSNGDQFGQSVVTNGSLFVVAAPNADGNTGTLYIYLREGTNNVLQQAVRVPIEFIAAQLGQAIALDGDTLIAGAPGFIPAKRVKGADADVVRTAIFVNTPDGWVFSQGLGGFGGGLNDQFGTAVAIHDDVLAIGAPRDSETAQNSGAVYVFTRTNGIWSFARKIKAPIPSSGQRFGEAIALSANRLAVGAPGAVVGSATSGAVALYTLSAGVPTGEPTEITATGPQSGASFGAAIAISDGTLLVGSPGENTQQGAVYCFSATNGDFDQRIQVTRPSNGDLFGFSVVADGDRVAVGAPGFSSAGAVFIADATFETQDRIDALDGYTGFGSAIGISGFELAIGAPQSTGTGAAAVLVDQRKVFSNGFE